MPLASGKSQRNTPDRDVLVTRFRVTALETWPLVNAVPAVDSSVPSGRYHSLMMVSAFGVSLSLQQSVLGVRQNTVPDRLLEISVRVTMLLLGWS